MHAFVPSEAGYLVTLGLVAAWKLPAWGQRLLSLKRDWDDYRAERSNRPHP